MKDRIVVSCLVLEGSFSGYRRVIKNLLEHQLNTQNSKFKWIFIFQKVGWDSLGIKLPVDSESIKIKIAPNFPNKWIRTLYEQVSIPFYALRYRASAILMPATFGLLFPLRPVLTFVNTNTTFSVKSSLRGRNLLEQAAHRVLVHITALTSKKLVFSSIQTYREYCQHLGRSFPNNILGHGIRLAGILSLKEVSDRVLPKKYLLSVSQIYRLKNFDGLIRSFINLKDAKKIPPEFCLVIVGTIKEFDYYNELIKLSKNRDDIVFLHNITDSKLATLFSNCFGYCFYSFFEGYSLTPGEALLSGVPISISDIPTHREIYGSSAFYADPISDSSIAKSILALWLERDDKALTAINETKLFLSFDSFITRLESELDSIDD